MMKTLWRRTYDRIAEPVVPMDNELLYRNAMKTLRDLTQEYEGSWGLPFACSLPNGEPRKVAFQFGFVGQQPNIGYQLFALRRLCMTMRRRSRRAGMSSSSGWTVP